MGLMISLRVAGEPEPIHVVTPTLDALSAGSGSQTRETRLLLKAWSEEQVQLDGLPPWHVLPPAMKASLSSLFENLPTVEVVSVFAERTPSPVETALSDEDEVTRPSSATVVIPGFDKPPAQKPNSLPEIQPPDWHQFLLYQSSPWEWQMYKDWSLGKHRLTGFPLFVDLPDPVRTQLQPLLDPEQYTIAKQQHAELQMQQQQPPLPPAGPVAYEPPPPPPVYAAPMAQPFFNELPMMRPRQADSTRPGRWYAVKDALRTLNASPPDGPFAPLPIPGMQSSDDALALHEAALQAEASSSATFAKVWSMTGRNNLIPCLPRFSATSPIL